MIDYKKGISAKGLIIFIVLIAVIFFSIKIVSRISENSKKDTYRSSANSILDTAKLYYTQSLLDSGKKGINGKTNLIDLIEITGKRPDKGELYINANGSIAIALLYNDICLKKDFNEANISETNKDNCTFGIEEVLFAGKYIKPTLEDTHKGIVYLNPIDLKETCNEELYKKNVNEFETYTKVNTGCMKFYIFDDTGDNYKMILDHNTSLNISFDKASEQLQIDTKSWTGNPRLISESEIRKITNNETDDYYYFGSLDKTKYEEQTKEQKSIQQSYHWLFDNLYQSKEFGGVISDDNEYLTGEEKSNIVGYWTDTKLEDGAYAWMIGNEGYLHYFEKDATLGIRPVINVSKSLIK